MRGRVPDLVRFLIRELEEQAIEGGQDGLQEGQPVLHGEKQGHDTGPGEVGAGRVPGQLAANKQAVERPGANCQE